MLLQGNLVERKKFRAVLRAHWQLIGVLVGAFLVAVSTGTYSNWDSQLEFEAASSVVTRGFPFVTTGLMINQPPLGFYMDAPVFQAFGLSYVNGVGVVTAFGLGCTVLVYVLGALLYGKRTGVVAAALFGIVPWHVFMSRIFLIDVQCLFFSLLFLIAGVLTVRRNSEKLLLVAGVVFGVAFLTKLFAVLMLIPLLLIVYAEKSGGFKLTLKKVLLFLVPSVVLQAVWFGGFANQNFFGVYLSSDFTHPVLIANPSLVFLPRTIVESAGWFLPIAAVFSLVLSVFYRKLFARTVKVDAVCVGTILGVASLDLLLVFGFHRIVPYVSAFKYNYVALPFFCLLAASLADKSGLLLSSMDVKRIIDKLKPLLVGVGLVLLFASMVESLVFLNGHESDGLVWFDVDSAGNYFPFNLFSSGVGSYFQEIHYAAIVLMVLSLIFPSLVNSLNKGFLWLSEVLSS
jgi:hypothetical protein